MKRVGCIVAALFCMAILFSSPLMAKTDAEKAQRQMTKTDRTEAQITDLHTKLKITPAQEDQWNKLASVMRENASQMDILVYNRKAKLGTMNAVDDLKSYKEISDAHTVCLAKFIAAFEPFYMSMSDPQKLIADATFAAKMNKHGHHKGHKPTAK
jgi:hypothetical protein